MIYVYMIEKGGLYYKHGRWVEKDVASVFTDADIAKNLAMHFCATLEVLEAKTVEQEVFCGAGNGGGNGRGN